MRLVLSPGAWFQRIHFDPVPRRYLPPNASPGYGYSSQANEPPAPSAHELLGVDFPVVFGSALSQRLEERIREITQIWWKDTPLNRAYATLLLSGVLAEVLQSVIDPLSQEDPITRGQKLIEQQATFLGALSTKSPHRLA